MPSNNTCHINISKVKSSLSNVIWFALVREPSSLEIAFLLWENKVQDITGRSGVYLLTTFAETLTPQAFLGKI